MDATFNLGDFYVTPITFRNCFLESKRSQVKASFCGPILIHYRKTLYSYKKLFDVVLDLAPELKELRSYGTDGERELMQALSSAFPNAKHLRCFLHLQKNIAQKMKSLKIAGEAKIISELKNLLTVDIANFDALFDTLISGIRSPELIDYFNEKRGMFRVSVHAHNNGGELFYTNASESINNKLKTFLNHKKSTLSQFLQSMIHFFDCEEGKAMEGYIGTSAVYKTADEFAATFKGINWMSLTESERKEQEKVFREISVETARGNDSTAQYSTEFDVKPETCSISVPLDILRQMFAKADIIIQGVNKIMMAPSASGYQCYSCISSTGNVNHNIRMKLDTKETVCDCAACKLYHICSHCIAAAHMEGALYSFIRHHRANHSRRTTVKVFTRSVDVTQAGRKKNERKRSRTPQAAKSTRCQLQVNRYLQTFHETTRPEQLFIQFLSRS